MAKYFYKKFLFHIVTLCSDSKQLFVTLCVRMCAAVAAAGRLTVPQWSPHSILVRS